MTQDYTQIDTALSDISIIYFQSVAMTVIIAHIKFILLLLPDMRITKYFLMATRTNLTCISILSYGAVFRINSTISYGNRLLKID